MYVRDEGEGLTNASNTEERESRIRRLMRATGENTKSGAIDVASKHYLADLERKHIDGLPPELVNESSTLYVPVKYDVTTHIDRTDD